MTSTLTVSSDEELVRAMARGDEAAFTCFYERYSTSLFGFLLHILRNHADAEDVLQLVFLEVWCRVADYDVTRGRPVAWLLKRARSRAIDYVRSRSVHGRKLDASAIFQQGIGGAAGDAAGQDRGIFVKAALAALSEEQRRVLDLAYFEGLTQVEMATLLAVPLGTVKTRVRDGLLKLRRLQAPKTGKPPRNAGPVYRRTNKESGGAPLTF